MSSALITTNGRRQVTHAENVLPVRTKVKRGSQGIVQKEIDECTAALKWLYVWGSCVYMDGFGKRRFANFCHRYNWDSKKMSPDGYLIVAEDGRHHEFGNNAN
jgi:hypothetical protein